MYKVFEIQRINVNKAKELLTDDVISRQSIFIRDAKAFDIDKDVQYILIEGSEEALKKASELFKDIANEPENKYEIYKNFKLQEESAAEGIGMIFG